VNPGPVGIMENKFVNVRREIVTSDK